MTKPRNDGSPWSDSDMRLLKEIYPDESNATLGQIFGRTPRYVQRKARQLGLSKSEAYMAAKPGCFKPGGSPWNKGTSFTAGGRSAETRFKKGNKPHTWRPVGTERVTKDGYLQRKVTDTGYSPDDYRMVHHLVWEEHTGAPVPKGHALIFRDGDKRNFDPTNLELVTRAELMHRNSYHTNYPPELRQIVQLRGALTNKINRRKRHA